MAHLLAVLLLSLKAHVSFADCPLDIADTSQKQLPCNVSLGAGYEDIDQQPR